MGVSSLISGYLSSEAQSDAAQSAANSAQSTAQIQAKLIKDIYNQDRADMLPFINAGQEALDKIKNFDATGGADQYLTELMNLTFPSGVDPTGGMQTYIDQLAGLDFQLDTNDPIYQWRAAENERTVNQFMASRGGYDSRAAANMLLSSGMELQAQETERQFNQRYLAKYNQLTDLAKLSFEKGQAEYGAATDKYGADVAKATTGFNAAMTMGSAKYNQLLDLVKAGTGASAASGATGQSASNQLVNVYGQAGQAQQNALLQQGAATAQMWNNVGQSSNNALMAYMMMN